MRVEYSQFTGGDGTFLSPDDLFASPGFIEFVLKYGEEGLKALPASEDAQIQALLEEMIAAGLLRRTDDGSLELTPRALRGMEHRAFLEIFRDMKPGLRDGHASPEPGARNDRTEGTRPYQFGDPISEIAMNESLRNALKRSVEEEPAQSQTGNTRARPLRLTISEQDLELYNCESSADSAICILMDLSGSMMRYGRHIAAKRVALGMRGLVRRNFPLDSIEYIGFASTASVLREQEIPLVMPRPITTHEWDVFVRVPLDQADRTHPHFTNLHHALRLARFRLARSSAANKQIFIITDGQPTAHIDRDAAGRDVLTLIYPPDDRTAEVTLTEALSCASSGIRISSFALIEEYHGMDWVGFIDQLTRLVRGVAFYCTAGDLGATIMESYLSGKKRKAALV